MSQTPIPDDLKEMYHFAQEWRREFGGERRYGAGTVEVLIERIGKAEAEVEALQRENDRLKGERDRQYEFNAGAIAKIATLERAHVPFSTADVCWCQPFEGPTHPECPMHGAPQPATQSTENER